jgi:hypothetical protein
LLGMPLEVDHIIPEAAGGKSELGIAELLRV